MKRDEILENIRNLSKSQGFYGRILNAIENSYDKEEILDELENQNFEDVVDLILYFEQ